MSTPLELWQGDCLDLMRRIPDGSVDLVAADLPYGTTACKWDTVIPFAPLWAHYRRILKPRGAVVLTASQPFTSALVMSNPGWFKYCLTWDKALSGNPLNAPYQPLKTHEDICVFSPAASTYSTSATMTYNPQMRSGEPYRKTTTGGRAKQIFRCEIERRAGESVSGDRYPTSILRISNAARNRPHRTAKPVALFEYLIRTYSNPGDLVLDNTMGSATTLIACLNTGRRGIGIEKDPEIFQTARRRVNAREAELSELLIPA